MTLHVVHTDRFRRVTQHGEERLMCHLLQRRRPETVSRTSHRISCLPAAFRVLQGSTFNRL